MDTPAPSLALTDGKARDALHRAVPVTRMLDYGMIRPDADALVEANSDGARWDEVCEQLADAHVRQAADCLERGDVSLASLESEWAAAALNVGQLAFNDDAPRKIDLYLRAVGVLEAAARSGGGDFHHVAADSQGRPVAGWRFDCADARGCALIIGGLSGWSISYFGLARALARRGVAALVLDGPGQGEARMRAGRMLSRAHIEDFAPAVADARAIGGKVAVVGNSFGGLIAAHVAARWSDVAACCINGAAPAPSVPEFRTAREQMAAAFGADGEALAALLSDFHFDPAVTPITCPTLVLEGGADPLVAPGMQRGFWADGRTPAGSTVRHWPDGEHTLYNHARERDSFVAAWISDRLAAAKG